jgi:NitT/TauT family transport system substrate-binding protein
MDKQTKRKLIPAALAITLAIVIVHTPGFIQGEGDPKILRIGYFPNINHAQAVIGFGNGDFQTHNYPYIIPKETD